MYDMIFNVYDELHKIVQYDKFTYWMKQKQLCGVLWHVFELVTINAFSERPTQLNPTG